jgi:isocitrate dehydrogenase (NAD+)
MFEAVHGSAPDIAGQGIANPCALILATAQMLDHLERQGVARRLRNAVREVIRSGDRVTPDLGGTGTTAQFADAIIERLGS